MCAKNNVLCVYWSLYTPEYFGWLRLLTKFPVVVEPPTPVAVNPASGGSRVLFSFENSEFFAFGRFGFILGMGVASIADRRDMMCTSTTTEGAP